MNSIILKAASRIVSGIVLVFAVYLLWRGHHAPGGGFIAGLIAATGFALIAIAEGPEAVRKGIVVGPQRLIGAGLCLSMGAGVAAVMMGKPFLTGIWWPAGNALVGTPFLFDVGVFLVVLGSILTVLLALEEY